MVHGDTVYLAGIVADHPIPDVAAQTGQILDQIDKLLAECGTDKSKAADGHDLARRRALLRRDELGVGQVGGAGNTPARACVEAKLAHPKYLVEIRVVAAR